MLILYESCDLTSVHAYVCILLVFHNFHTVIQVFILVNVYFMVSGRFGPASNLVANKELQTLILRKEMTNIGLIIPFWVQWTRVLILSLALVILDLSSHSALFYILLGHLLRLGCLVLVLVQLTPKNYVGMLVAVLAAIALLLDVTYDWWDKLGGVFEVLLVLHWDYSVLSVGFCWKLDFTRFLGLLVLAPLLLSL